jgi:DNA replication licensing factor MCM2
VRGVVTRRYAAYSQLKKLYYVCRCGDRKGPIYENSFSPIRLGQCVYCHSNGPYFLDSESAVYKSNQKITIQESPSTVPPGRVPRSKDVVLLGDNIDAARPGDEVEIVGIYSTKFDFGMNVKHGFPVFSTYIEGNAIKRVQELEMAEITAEDREAIIRLSRDPNVLDVLVNAIAPSIYGHRSIKTALALALFGGSSIETDTHRVRGDINVLLVGDPGLSKSQFLKYVQTVSPRSVYTTGKGASAVGLTACVRKDPVSGEWSLEGGALVLADNGICLIDEFDKMNEADRTSIHEAMEQQSISISKAGIVANLQARCSVIAAANPIKGLYDNQLGFQDNLNLSEPILSRFDVICVLKDELDLAHDKSLANFIIKSHRRSQPEALRNARGGHRQPVARPDIPLPQLGDNPAIQKIPQSLLKKYILFARSSLKPKLTAGCNQKIQNFYTKLRAVSQSISGITVVVRHLESLVRFAQASAKMHLRNETNERDVDLAISMLLDSFLQSTKPSIAKGLETRFSYEINQKRNINSFLAHLLNRLVKRQIEYLDIIRGPSDDVESTVVKIPLAVLAEKAKEHQIYNVDDFLRTPAFQNNYVLQNEIIVKEI